MRIFFEPSYQGSRPFERRVKIVDAEEQQQPVAGGSAIGLAAIATTVQSPSGFLPTSLGEFERLSHVAIHVDSPDFRAGFVDAGGGRRAGAENEQ